MGKRSSRKIKFQALEQWLTLHPSDPPLGWTDLPADLTENILQRLGPIEILETAQSVCATWRTVCQDPLMWRFIDMSYHSKNRYLFRRLRSSCRRAVDHSMGELIDFNIVDFGNDDLLLYVSDRSSHLKRLRIEYCEEIGGLGLAAAVANWPELEELHLILMRWFHHEDIGTIGKCCPMLKSFTFSGHVNFGHMVDNRVALAIARNMPNLRRLDLSGNALGDGGVKAILDGCPLLESIDLRECFKLHLDKQKCFESINDVRRVFDHSTADHYDQSDDEDGYYSDGGYSIFSLSCCHSCFGDEYREYHPDDYEDEVYYYDDVGDGDVDDDFGYYYNGENMDQIEVNYWDAMDLSKKGDFVHCNFPLVEEILNPYA